MLIASSEETAPAKITDFYFNFATHNVKAASFLRVLIMEVMLILKEN